MLKVGATLQERYHIEKVLGQGGMGAVYLASQTLLGGKKVAIKETIMPTHSAQEREKAQQQFQREATTLARLDHPGLVSVIDFLQESDSYFLIMEFIPGSTLEDLLVATQTAVEVPLALAWIDAVCDVLIYLHEQLPPVIFRDLKPSNIMLDDRGRIRVIDFGIAKTLEDNTKTHTIIRGAGTPGYSPLEQFAGTTDPRSDIYALGATLYTLVTLQIPPASMAIAAQEATLIAPSEVNPQIPLALSAVIMKMMELFKEERYATVAEARQALLQSMNANAPVDTSAQRRITVIEKAKSALPNYKHVALKTTRGKPREPGEAVTTSGPPAGAPRLPTIDPSMPAALFPQGEKPVWAASVESVPLPADKAKLDAAKKEPLFKKQWTDQDKIRFLLAGLLFLMSCPYFLAHNIGPVHWINLLCYRVGNLVGSDLVDAMEQMKILDADPQHQLLAIIAGVLLQVLLPVLMAFFMLQTRSSFWVFPAFLWLWLNVVEIGTYLRDVSHGVLGDAVAHDWKRLITAYDLQNSSALYAFELHVMGEIGMFVSVLLMIRALFLTEDE